MSEQHTQRQLISDLLGRAFGGSLQKLIIQALSAERASPKELWEVRRLIEEVERKKAGQG